MVRNVNLTVTVWNFVLGTSPFEFHCSTDGTKAGDNHLIVPYSSLYLCSAYLNPKLNWSTLSIDCEAIKDRSKTNKLEGVEILTRLSLKVTTQLTAHNV